MSALRLCMSVAVLAISAPASAADYPFNGYFTSQEASLPPDQVQLACAFGFFRQDLDGSFTGYLIDIDRYRADKTLRYLQYGRGQCAIDGTGKVETCTMTASADKSEIGQSYYDVMGARTANSVDTAIFDTLAAAKLYATVGKGDPTAELRISRCAGFDATKLAPFLSEEETTLSLDQRGELLAPVVDDANRPVMTEIFEKLIGNR
jgi:hypothetical protein